MELTGSNLDGDPNMEQLEEANQQLQESLKACHDLVAQYRSKLAANGNDPPLPGERGDDSDTVSS